MGLPDEFEEGNWKYKGSGQNFDDSTLNAWNWSSDPTSMHNDDIHNCAATTGESSIYDALCNDSYYTRYGLCEIKTKLC